MVRRRLVILGTSLAAVLWLAPDASASKMIAWGVHNPTLIVNRHHIARVSYTDAHGVRRHVLAWHARNAIAPARGRRQVRFRLDYSGGYGSFGNGYWRRMRNACRPYSGPPLLHLVAACTDTNGTFWALQTWRRRLLDGGWRGTRRQMAPELHLSHWSGRLPRLHIETDWAVHGRFDHLFGRFTYHGNPVYGFSATPSGSPLDGFGRNVYIDVKNPPWGRGWYRFNGALSHRPSGVFCFGMYALFGRRRPAKGTAYRATVMGPGVTPIVRWKGPSPGPYDPAVDAARNADEQAMAPPGDACHRVS
jgi:hypothetical protein